MSDTAWNRAVEEIRHWLRSDWSFADVGEHWDHIHDYDDTNEETYSYFRRFTDGLRMSSSYIPDGSHILDFCARTGNGILYFYQHGKVGSAVCADVSKCQGEICIRRLRDAGFENFTWIEVVDDYRLPFDPGEFDAVLCFETIEHFPQPEALVAEFGRVTRIGGTMVLTTPNVLWEPVHAFAAVANLHHSEGPHRFIRYGRLLRMVEAAGFQVERAETTVLVPTGPAALIKLGEWIEESTKNSLMPWMGLRRVLICRKL